MSEARDMAIFLALEAVPIRLRGGWWIRLAERQMRRWHPDLDVARQQETPP